MKKKCIYSEICTRVVCVNRGKMYRILYYMAGKGTFAIALHVLVYPSKAITMRQFWAAWQFAEIHMIRSRYIRSQQSFTYYTIAHTHNHDRCVWNDGTVWIRMRCVDASFFVLNSNQQVDGWMDAIAVVRTFKCNPINEMHKRNVF